MQRPGIFIPHCTYHLSQQHRFFSLNADALWPVRDATAGYIGTGVGSSYSRTEDAQTATIKEGVYKSTEKKFLLIDNQRVVKEAQHLLLETTG